MIDSVTFTFSAIFLGAALLASLALYTRQPIVIAYIALGMALGPFGLAVIDDIDLVAQSGHVGIIFLLFLLGLDMQPRALVNSLRAASLVGITSSLIFAAVSSGVMLMFGFGMVDAALTGAALMFSSTIIGIKLLPTTVLHHRHIGELLVALLLFQDLLAIVVLVVLQNLGETASSPLSLLWPLASLPMLAAVCWAVVRLVLLPLLQKFDRYHEYIFLLSVGWCLGVAEAAALLGLSAEIGAFIAGVTVATSPIAQYIAVSLKPLRDFFLVIFFFAVGAQFDSGRVADVGAIALVLALVLLAIKPLAYQMLLRGISERRELAWNLGFRLGQCSEFALLIAFLGSSLGHIGKDAATVIQATTILTLVISSYIVVFNFPTPIAIRDELRRD